MHVYVRTQICSYIHTHTYIHAYIHTYAQTHTHLQHTHLPKHTRLVVHIDVVGLCVTLTKPPPCIAASGERWILVAERRLTREGITRHALALVVPAHLTPAPNPIAGDSIAPGGGAASRPRFRHHRTVPLVAVGGGVSDAVLSFSSTSRGACGGVGVKARFLEATL